MLGYIPTFNCFFFFVFVRNISLEMPRPKKARPKRYKSYNHAFGEENVVCEIPESTLRSQTKRKRGDDSSSNSVSLFYQKHVKIGQSNLQGDYGVIYWSRTYSHNIVLILDR